MSELLDIESYIDARPDSALAALRQIDTLSLGTKSQKAKYALLHAIALDKNYIDTADMRIVMPAVKYYDKHGTSEERLKAYMYLGVEQYNAGLYNEAIVSFYKAAEYAPKINDQNLLGVLYSKMADTYVRTQEYIIADNLIDKSIDCFQRCGRKDQENLEKLLKAQNLVQLKDWETADSLFISMLNDPSLSGQLKGIVEGYYAIMILSSPNSNDSLAFTHMNNAISSPSGLQDYDQYCAYAYLLGLFNSTEASDSVFNSVQRVLGRDHYSINYWKHRFYKQRGDYRKAYQYLWAAKHYSDSISNVMFAVSAANAQRLFFERQEIEKDMVIINQRNSIIAYSLLIIAIIALASSLLLFKRKRHLDELGRMSIIIDALREQLNSMTTDRNHKEQRLGELFKENAKARLSYLADLYEILYHYERTTAEPDPEKLFSLIKDRIKILKQDSKAQLEFEDALNKESDNIIQKFRNDYPELSEAEFRLASYVFAGFDNTSIMLIMEISTLEYTRVKKNRLKKKIMSSTSVNKDTYLSYFNNQ